MQPLLWPFGEPCIGASQSAACEHTLLSAKLVAGMELRAEYRGCVKVKERLERTACRDPRTAPSKPSIDLIKVIHLYSSLRTAVEMPAKSPNYTPVGEKVSRRSQYTFNAEQLHSSEHTADV